MKHFDEAVLKQNNPEIFIQFIHYLLITHEPALYKEVLSIAPEIKLANDKRFMKLSYLVFRKILEKHPSLTVDSIKKTEDNFLDILGYYAESNILRFKGFNK